MAVDASAMWRLAALLLGFCAVGSFLGVGVIYPTTMGILNWYKKPDCVTDVNAIGPELGATKSEDVVTLNFTMPVDVPRLTSPTGTCTGLVQLDDEEMTCIPYLAGNGTLGLCGACTEGQTIRLGGNGTCFDCFTESAGGLGLCGACTAGQTIRLGSNGTCFDCVTGGAGGLELCGACTAGQSIRLGSNSTCYDCYTPATPPLGLCGECAIGETLRIGANGTCYDCYTPNVTAAALPLTGTGGVGTEQRTNDTLVYTNAFSWITDPMPATAYISSYIFSSGSSSVTVWPPGMAGNTVNGTMYKLDLAMNVYLTLNPFAAPNPDLGAVLLFSGIDAYFPVPVTNPYIDRFHSVGSASCAYYNGATPLQLPFGGHGAHNNVGTYVFYFPMLDSGSYPVYTGRCELRIEMWLESP